MLAIAASKRSPGLLANFISGMVQEHERAVGGLQGEWITVQGIVQSAAVALESAKVADGLPARMRANIAATHGAVFTEPAMMILAPEMGRDAALHVVEEAFSKPGEAPDLRVLETPESIWVARILPAAARKVCEDATGIMDISHGIPVAPDADSGREGPPAARVGRTATAAHGA